MNQSPIESAYAQGIGFAIPSNTVRTVVAAAPSNPGVHQGTDAGFIGSARVDLTAGFRNQTGYNGQGGIGVGQVFPGSPADKPALEPGDVILQADGKPITTATRSQLHRLQEARRHHPPRSLVARRQEIVAINLEERPADQVGAPQQGNGQGP